MIKTKSARPARTKGVPSRGPAPAGGDDFLFRFVRNELGGKHGYRSYLVRRERGTERLLFRSRSRRLGRTLAQEETLAVRLRGGAVLYNADELKFCVRGRRAGGTSAAQRALERAGAIGVAFSVFETLGLRVEEVEIVSKAPEETFTFRHVYDRCAPVVETRHFVGACVLRAGEAHFLFDVDREDIAAKVFNPFITRLPRAAKTVEEAYLSLKPLQVVVSELEGLPVRRQGEFFFVRRYEGRPDIQPPKEILERAAREPDPGEVGALPISLKDRPDCDGVFWNFPSEDAVDSFNELSRLHAEAVEKVEEHKPQPGLLRSGEDNHPHRVSLYMKIGKTILASGIVTHDGGEHAPLNLGSGYWEVLSNRAIQSWHVNGRVD